MIYINLVVEDILQEHLLRKVLLHCYEGKLEPESVIGKRGNSFIKKNLRSYNNASVHKPYLILTDLDRISCPSELIKDWIVFPTNRLFFFRIAVREAEAWILSDRKNFANYIGVPYKKVPENSETIPNPKELIINLSKDSSKRNIREDLIPEGTARVGKNYNSCLSFFIYNNWNVGIASINNNSLAKLIQKLTVLVK